MPRVLAVIPSASPRPEPRVSPARPDVPDRLPLRVKFNFLVKSEVSFLQVLDGVLPDGYRVFANVRLNDVFFIATRQEKYHQATRNRLSDKHVDFLVVSLPDYRPVLAIELDGASHDAAEQQYRDAVKDVAFRSAGLPLIRLRAEVTHTAASVRILLNEHLSIGRVRA